MLRTLSTAFASTNIPVCTNDSIGKCPNVHKPFPNIPNKSCFCSCIALNFARLTFDMVSKSSLDYWISEGWGVAKLHIFNIFQKITTAVVSYRKRAALTSIESRIAKISISMTPKMAFGTPNQILRIAGLLPWIFQVLETTVILCDSGVSMRDCTRGKITPSVRAYVRLESMIHRRNEAADWRRVTGSGACLSLSSSGRPSRFNQQKAFSISAFVLESQWRSSATLEGVFVLVDCGKSEILLQMHLVCYARVIMFSELCISKCKAFVLVK